MQAPSTYRVALPPRDNAQTAVISEGTRPNAAALLAEADRVDLTGNRRTALELLVKVTTH